MYFSGVESFFYILGIAVSLAALAAALVIYRVKQNRRKRYWWSIESLLERMESMVQAGDMESAVKAGRRASGLLDLYFPFPSPERAQVMKRLSWFEEDRERPGSAEELLAEALRTEDEIDGHGLDNFPDRLRLSVLKSRQGRLAEAMEDLEELESRLPDGVNAETAPLLSSLLNHKSLLQVSEGGFELALASIDRAVELEEQHSPGSESLVIYMKSRGDLNDHLERHEASLEDYGQALRLAIANSYTEEAARLTDRVRLWYKDRPDPQHEPSFWREALELASRSEDGADMKDMFIASLAEVGYEYALEEDPEDLLAEALKREAPEDSLGRAFLIRARARLDLDYGDYGAALPGMKQALQVFSLNMGVADSSVINFALEIGDVYIESGNFEDALNLYREAETVIRKTDGGHHPGLPSIYLRIVECLTELELQQEVKEYCERALHITEKMAPKSSITARLLFYKARAEVETGRTGKAVDLLERSRDICLWLGEMESQGTSLFFLSTVYQIRGDLENALRCARSARECYRCAGLHDQDAMGEIYARLSSVYAGLGDDKRSLQFANYAMNTWAVRNVVEKRKA